jgi:hypothetical protein
VDLIVNTPFGSPGQSGPRLDGYEIRTAAVRSGVPCVTTVQGLGAAVQGIEAIQRGEVGVRSLQEYAAFIRGDNPPDPPGAPAEPGAPPLCPPGALPPEPPAPDRRSAPGGGKPPASPAPVGRPARGEHPSGAPPVAGGAS